MTTLCKLIARYYSSSYRGFTLELLSNYIGRSTILESRLETFIHSGFHWTLIRPAVSASDLATVWRYRNSITIIFGTHHKLWSSLIQFPYRRLLYHSSLVLVLSKSLLFWSVHMVPLPFHRLWHCPKCSHCAVSYAVCAEPDASHWSCMNQM